MPKTAIFVLIGIPVLILGILTGFYLLQEKLIFFPQKLPGNHQYTFEGLNFEELNFTTADGNTLNALHFKAENPKGVVLYFHGNAGNLQSWGYVAEDYIPLNMDVLIYDYRGYGKSTGKIRGEKKFHTNAKMIYQKLLEKWDEKKIIVHGTSLGSGIAVKLCSEFQPAALVLETPYYSFLDVARHHYAMLPASLILKYRFRTDKHIKKVECPVYIFHGTSDQVVPYQSSKKIVKEGGDITLITLPKGQHNGLSTFPKYSKKLEDIVKKEIK